MSAQNPNPVITILAGEALAIFRRVKLDSAGAAVYADAGDSWIGITQTPAVLGAATPVRLRNSPGTFLVAPVGAVAIGDVVYEAADGKIDATGSNIFGVAREATAAACDGIEILPTVDTATHADSSVTAAKLANAVADAVASVSVAVANTGTPDGVANITVQAKDIQGNNLAARVIFRIWFAATAYAAPADLGTLTASTGVLLKEDTDDALATVVTDGTGAAVLALDTTINGTVHAMAACSGICATANAAITGN